MNVARSYAKALYSAIEDESLSPVVLDQTEVELNLFLEMLTQSKPMKIALLGPLTSAKEKANLTLALGKALGVCNLTSRFFVLLAKKGRFALLNQICTDFTMIRLEAEKGVCGNLVSADTVLPGELDHLVKVFSQKLGKKVAFQVSTDPSVLAGMKVTVNGVTYDGTLQSQIQKLSEHFVVSVAHT